MPDLPDTPSLSTIPEAEKITGLGPTKLAELGRAGILTFVRLGHRTVRIPTEELITLADRLKAGCSGPRQDKP